MLREIFFVFLLASTPVVACTLWGAAGSASREGTLLAKNRDWKPDHVQSVRLVHSTRGLDYVGLYADGSRVPGLKAGVNRAGLSVVSASASSLPHTQRDAAKGERGLLQTLLAHYHDLDDVARNADALFSDRHPAFLLLADAKGLMQVEIGQGGLFAINRTSNGTLAHTNHYLDTNIINAQIIGDSSATRLQRIQALLAEQPGNHTLAEFARFSNDHTNGPDKSLWRTGKEFTLAAWQISLPQSGAPHLHLVLANPGMEKQSVDWQLDSAFWARAAGVLLGQESNELP